MADYDPSTLSDEELDKLIAGEDIEPTPPEAGTPAPTEEEVPPAPAAPETEEETPPADPAPQPAVEEEEEVRPPSRREQLRVQQLLNKMSQQPETPAPQAPAQIQGLNYAEELDADEETIKRLEEDRAAAVAAATKQQSDFQIQLQSSEWRTKLDIDAPQVESKYEVLNPNDSEHFHPVLADTLSSWYLNQVQYDAQTNTVRNPNLRWGEFVEGVMELAEEIANTKVATATQNITRQAAQTAIRPDGSSSKKLNLNQAPESMTDEELDAFLGQAFPK